MNEDIPEMLGKLQAILQKLDERIENNFQPGADVWVALCRAHDGVTEAIEQLEGIK